jgi:hypothetical protein
MYDVHTLVDIGSLAVAIVSGYLAARRSLVDRIAKVEDEIAEHRGVLKGAGLLRG